MSQNNKRPFRYETRQNRQKVGQIAFSASGGTPLELPRVGMLSRIILIWQGIITLSGTGTRLDLSPWNLLNRIKVNANIGAATIWDTTGYGAYLAQQMIDRQFRPDLAGAGSTSVDTLLHVVPIASGANTWTIAWILNIGANQGSNFEAGLINLQSPEVRVTVEPTFCALTDVDALCTAITGNLNVYYEYYELPNPANADIPPLMVVRTIEDSQPISGTGDNIYTVPRQGVMLWLLHWLRLNALRSNNYDSIAFKLNKTTTIYQEDKALLRLINREFTGCDFPTGAYALDFWHGGESLSAGDNRDVIDTEEMSTIESIVTVTSGSTLGTNTNFFNSIRRIVQVFQA